MFMLNKKNLIIFLCILKCLFVYADLNKLDLVDNLYAHEDFYINKNGKQNRYRIQMHFPRYSYYVDSKTCKYVECFPNYEMGIALMQVNKFPILDFENGNEKNYISVMGNVLYIFPDIIMKTENLKDVFSIKGTTREGGFICNCFVSYWEIHENGLLLDIIYEDRPISVYLVLKDGKYYEAENADNLGVLRQKYSASDFFYDYFTGTFRYKFTYDGCSIYKLNGSKIISELVDEITFYNPTKTGIEFITPYGCGFFDFETESVSLVPKEKYLGKEFTYVFLLDDHDFKGGKARKIITEADLNPPDIKVLLEDKDIRK